MEYRTLGRTGVKVSTHCLGAMMFGDWGNTDVDECERIIHKALDGGINFVDTADVYSSGRSEEIVGKALQGRRDEVILATKCHGAMGGRNERGSSRHWITRAVEDSLRRLATDHIDLYQLHRPDFGVDLEESLGALTDLVHQGKVRYIGSSTYPAWWVVQSQWVSERRNLERFVCEQPPYSIFARAAERDVFEVTQRFGMGVIVWSPLAGGWLTGKYRRDQGVPEGSRAERAGKQWAGSPVADRFDMTRPTNQTKLDVVEQLETIADKAGVSMTHMAIAFTLAHPAVTSAIIGPRTMDQLDDLLDGADARLDESTLDAIDEIVEPGGYFEPADLGWQPPWLSTKSAAASHPY